MRGREVCVTDLVDVEAKLGANVLRAALGISDGVAVLLAKLGKLDRHGEVGCICMPDVVADVVRQRTDCEGQLVSISGVAKQVDYEVSGTDIVGEIGVE